MTSEEKTSKMSLSILHRLPVVVILGATGTGKSKLATHLARKLGGEVISADSMQVYKGLDILTNKMTTEEMSNVPHHMISVVKPCENFDVKCFRNQALPILEGILSKGKIPFIVGGTNYYIESLLWEVLIGTRETQPRNGNDSEVSEGDLTNGSGRKRKMDDQSEDVKTWDNEILSFFARRVDTIEEDVLTRWSPLELHAALREVDDERASRLHPNDVRKIIRSLQVRFQTGRKHSDLIAEQHITSLTPQMSDDDRTNSTNSSMPLGGPLRFTNALCLWIRTPQDVLDKRIEARVDEMVVKGLRQELNSYFEELLVSKKELDFTRGLLQSIGFKEFRTYLQQPSEDRDTEEGEKLFEQGLAELKLATKRYARKQLKWINQRFLRPSRRQVPPVYWLDCSSVGATEWDEEVILVSEKILEARLSGRTELDLPLLSERRVIVQDVREDDVILRTCKICDRSFLGKVQWDSHMSSRKHRLMQRKIIVAESLLEKAETVESSGVVAEQLESDDLNTEKPKSNSLSN